MFTESELQILRESERQNVRRGPRPRAVWKGGLGRFNRQEAIALFQSGLTNQAIADLAGVVKRSASRCRVLLGLPRAPMPKYPPRHPRRSRL